MFAQSHHSFQLLFHGINIKMFIKLLTLISHCVFNLSRDPVLILCSESLLSSNMAIVTLLCILLLPPAIYFAATSTNTAIQEEYPSGSLACKMFDESVLDCSRRDLFVTPLIDKHNATSVDLSDNKIEQISRMAFADQIQLTSIDFSNNQLINITDSPFADLGLLVHLNLSFNQISFLASTAFTGLHNLMLLNISFNDLIFLPDDVFRDLQNIICLDLKANQLTVVPGLALSHLVNLEVLFLDNNPFTAATFGKEFELLTHLNTFVFSTSDIVPKLTNKKLRHLIPSSLRSIGFIWNPFTKVEVGIFDSFKNIETLVVGPVNLGQQPFPVSSSVRTLVLHAMQPIITRNFFMPLSNLNESLTELDLCVNMISAVRLQATKLEDFAFEWFPSLLRLDLQTSPVGDDPIELSQNTFNGLVQLECLSLKQTRLMFIPSAAFRVFAQTGSLRQLDLSENSLTGNFPDDAFASVTSLEQRDLSYNRISKLSKWIERLTT